LADEVVDDGGGEELCGLDLLGNDSRLGFGTGSGDVVARERQEHHEPEKDRESGRQHAENAGGAVTIVEVAALRCPPAHEEHGGDRHRCCRHDDQKRKEEVHEPASPTSVRSIWCPAVRLYASVSIAMAKSAAEAVPRTRVHQ